MALSDSGEILSRKQIRGSKLSFPDHYPIKSKEVSSNSSEQMKEASSRNLLDISHHDETNFTFIAVATAGQRQIAYTASPLISPFCTNRVANRRS
jgi:hypothetical protein